MDIFGIGPLEFVLILIIALIIFGPNDIVSAGRTLGRLLYRLVTSDAWRTVQATSREMRDLPNRLIKEAGMENLKGQFPNPNQLNKDLGLDQLSQGVQSARTDLSAWTNTPSIGGERPGETPAPASAPVEGPPTPPEKPRLT
jgi:Sec-independent protein translocase protein TatA